jgi:UDP-N-acetylmuramate--alanine ligase
MTETFFFCGIGGSGMSAIAQVLLHNGHVVRGSDRSHDTGKSSDLYEKLAALGVDLYPQDGSGVDDRVDTLVVSSAVESTIPDVRAALDLGIPIQKRAEVLARLFNQGEGIAVGGTSGKTTVTGMIGHILKASGRNPTVINGGIMLNAVDQPGLGNALCGDPSLPVVEADESDGTIALYHPKIAVLTNISLDHKSIEELEHLFGDFCRRATGAAVVNLDCKRSADLTRGISTRVGFGLDNRSADPNATDVHLLPDGAAFLVNDTPCRLYVPGRHNISNALAAIAACSVLGVPTPQAAGALGSFQGIGRRLQVIGQKSGVTVLDDFAHNPDKIAASLAALKAQPGRLLVVFQPHGFAPTRLLKNGLIDAFATGMDDRDLLVMLEIFYAGGTAQKDISSEHLIEAVGKRNRRAEFINDRGAIARRLAGEARAGDRIVVMGARDDTLTDFAKAILACVA